MRPVDSRFSRLSVRVVFRFSLLALLSALFAVDASAQNPVPYIQIVSPVSIAPGSSSVTLTVRGAGFVSASVVHWNSSALTTTFVNSKELMAVVPTDLVAAVGLGQITVVSPTPGGRVSNVQYVPVASPEATTNFPATPSSSPSVGGEPTGIVIGDFNGDGKVDLAVTNSGDGTVTILLNNGNGVFTPQTPISVGAGANWLVTGDFNEDGISDLAVANHTDDNVSILLGTGNGTFTLLATKPGTGSSPFAIAAGDFNGDGHLDLAVSNSGDGTVTVLLGDGTGGFTNHATPAVGSNPQVLVVGDFNEDGKLDIAVSNENDNTVTVLLGSGSGTFPTSTTASVGGSGYPIGLIEGDYNGDGHLDVAAVNASDVAILLGNGTGSLTLHANPTAGENLISGVTGDYNGDGNLDIVVADQSLNEAFLFLGNGDGTFVTPAPDYPTAAGTYSAATADFNGDGALDLAFTDNNSSGQVSIFLQTLPMSLAPTSLAFGNQALGSTSAAMTTTLTNNTASSVAISDITITGSESGSFSLNSTTCGTSLTSNASCAIHVTFTPQALGALGATLTVTDAATNSPQTLALTGTGTAQAPTIAKAFGTSSIPLNGSTSLTFTITNPNSGNSLTGLTFTDTLPSGMLVAATPALANTCGGTVTAAAGTSSVSLSSGTLAASSSCTVSVNVDGTAAGVKNNSVTVSSTEGGTGNTSTANLTVLGPPTFSKSFGATSIPIGGSTSLTFSVQNPNTTQSLSGVAFTDTLPAGLVISTPNGFTGSCTSGTASGTVTATAGSSVITGSVGTMTASASCTFGINVTATAAGTQSNVTSAITSTDGGSGATASANLTVVAPPSIAKAFVPTSIAPGGVSALTFTVTNPAANTVAQAGVAFTDSLPPVLVVATPNGLTNMCGGTVLAAAGSSSISLTGGSIAVSSSCTVVVNVTAASAGQYLNSTGNVSSTNGGTGNSANATLNVASAPSIAKAFGASVIPLNTSTSLTFTIQNPNTAVTLTGVAFTDNLPAGLVVATSSNLSNNCGGTATATGGSSTVTLSAGTLTTSASCTVSLNVTATTTGVKNNSVTVSSTQGGTGNTSNANLTVLGPPTFSKSFGATSIPVGGSTSLTFSVQNPNTTQSLSGVAFTDTLPAGLVISTPNGFTGSCGGGTITATAGSSAISLSGATLAASGSCSFGVNLTGTAAGQQNNTTSTISSTQGGNGAAASANLIVEAPPAIAKAFTPTAIALGATTSLTFTITNPAANPAALTGVAFTDTLPSGLSVTSGSSAACGGTLTTTAPVSITLTGATIAISGQCQFSVTITGATAGQYTNVTGSVSSTNGGTGNTASAGLSVGAAPTISKAFGSTTIPLNGSTSLTFMIANPNTTLALTGVGFTDTLPAGLVVSTPSGLSGSCGTGSVTATAGSSTVMLASGTITANGSCSFGVNVTGTTLGTKANITGAISANESGAGTTSNAAALTVLAGPAISAAFGTASIDLSASTSLSFTIDNSNSSIALTGVAVTDTLPAGLVVATPNGLTGTCGAGTITASASSTSIVLTGGTIAGGGSCVFAVNVTAIGGGTLMDTTGAVTSTNGGTGNEATASLSVLVPDLAVAKSHVGNFQQGQTGAIYTITVSNVGTAPSRGTVTLTDTLPAALTATAFSGTGWTCTLSTVSCTRGDALAAGGNYPSLTLTVSVSGIASASVTNSVTVSGGGETNTSNDTANDVTSVTVVPPDFSFTIAPAAATIAAGQSASFTLTLAPMNNVPFSTPITFTVSGAPQGASLVFQPTTVTPGSSAGTCTVVITASQGDPYLTGSVHERMAPLFAMIMPVAGIVLAGLSSQRKLRRNALRWLGVVLLLVGAGVALFGCASAQNFRKFGTPAGAYTLTVTAAGGTVQHSVTAIVTVQQLQRERVLGLR